MSAINIGGGRNPQWKDKFTLNKYNENEIIFQFWNRTKSKLFKNKMVCSGRINLDNYDDYEFKECSNNLYQIYY